jgi:hypothetical protein
MLIGTDGNIVWDRLADTTQNRIRQHRIVGCVHFLPLTSEQRFVPDWRSSCVLYYSWCRWLNNGSNRLNETEKLHHFEHIFHQRILVSQTFGVLPPLLSKLVLIGKLIHTQWLNQLAILPVFN